MQVAWWGLIPFVTMLLSIAVLPLHPVTAHHWERPKVQVAVALPPLTSRSSACPVRPTSRPLLGKAQ